MQITVIVSLLAVVTIGWGIVLYFLLPAPKASDAGALSKAWADDIERRAGSSGYRGVGDNV